MELIRVQDSDYKRTYELYMSFLENENGYVNNVYGYDYKRFLEWIVYLPIIPLLQSHLNYIYLVFSRDV